MPVVLIIVAICLLAAGVRGSYAVLGGLIKGDLTGQGNFLNWLAAIGLVGMIGYIPRLTSLSRAFLALILVAMLVKQGGFFSNFVAAIQGAQAGNTNPNPGNPGASSGSGGILDQLGGALFSSDPIGSVSTVLLNTAKSQLPSAPTTTQVNPATTINPNAGSPDLLTGP